jgi:Predicted periplasmic solute-binding protein
VIIS